MNELRLSGIVGTVPTLTEDTRLNFSDAEELGDYVFSGLIVNARRVRVEIVPPSNKHQRQRLFRHLGAGLRPLGGGVFLIEFFSPVRAVASPYGGSSVTGPTSA